MTPAEELADIPRRVEAFHTPGCFTVGNLIIGPRQVRGVYAVYEVSWWAYPIPGKAWIGGTNRHEFRFDNDPEDAALRSAEL